ncbi:hypothetical protein ACIBG8_23175 [Nonomuraea sp. NPDC050556]|uniref:hypothetical protein n=1 Tax=Nonomuraea sp. NPDC050556 TaxID=3364369 RepID=UPI0037A449A4
MSYEELGFGDEGPEREVRLGPWLAEHARLVGVLIGVVLLAVVVVIAGVATFKRSLLPVPPPDGPIPAVLDFEVALCAVCPQGEVTVRESVEELLGRLPQVESFEYVTYARSSEETRALVISPWREVGEPPEGGSFRGKVRRAEDIAVLREKVSGVPGVAQVFANGPHFWRGKAQVFVGLCAKDWPGVCKNQAATLEQRNAIAAALKRLDNVEEVYLEDQAFRNKLMGAGPGRDSFEALYVKVDDPARARAVGEAVKDMPGVAVVTLIEAS